MEIMVYPGFFSSIWPVWDLEALLRNLRGADPCAQASSTCLWICHNCWLIYAASWTQLFPMSTVVKTRWDADSLKTDWMPLLVFIWGASHQCVDWRWMFCPCRGGRGLLNFVNLIAPYISSTISSFSTLLCAVSLICRRNEPIGCPHPPLFASLTPLFHHSSLFSHLHYFLFFLSHPSVLLSLAFKGQAPALLAPRFPFDWPDSLFTSPRHKRHQADWSAGRSRGHGWSMRPWAGGRRVGGREDGWRAGGEGGEGRREGWTGRLTDAQSADQSMGTFAELR